MVGIYRREGIRTDCPPGNPVNIHITNRIAVIGGDGKALIGPGLDIDPPDGEIVPPEPAEAVIV